MEPVFCQPHGREVYRSNLLDDTYCITSYLDILHSSPHRPIIARMRILRARAGSRPEAKTLSDRKLANETQRIKVNYIRVSNQAPLILSGTLLGLLGGLLAIPHPSQHSKGHPSTSAYCDHSNVIAPSCRDPFPSFLH